MHNIMYQSREAGVTGVERQRVADDGAESFDIVINENPILCFIHNTPSTM